MKCYFLCGGDLQTYTLKTEKEKKPFSKFISSSCSDLALIWSRVSSSIPPVKNQQLKIDKLLQAKLYKNNVSS